MHNILTKSLYREVLLQASMYLRHLQGVFNLLAPELFFFILAHSVYKM